MDVLGRKISEFTSIANNELISVKLELFNNNNFLCATSDSGEMTVEHVGNYKLENNTLYLTLKNETSEHVKSHYKILAKNIGTWYAIENDTLLCIDCSSPIQLKKNKQR